MTVERTRGFHAYRTGVATLLLFLTFAAQVTGQKPSGLPPDHPEVYYSFFFFMEGFGQWINLRGVQTPEKQAALTASAARYLKVDAKELPTLLSTCQSVAANLRQINGDSHQFWVDESAKGKVPDAATMRSFEAKRQAAIQGGIAQMQQVLSRSSWNGIHSHINGAHRAMVRPLH